MKLYKFSVLALVFALFAFTDTKAETQHFEFTETSTSLTFIIGSDATVKIGDDPLEEGDEIAIFSSRRYLEVPPEAELCGGAVVYESGVQLVLNAFAEELFPPQEGLRQNEFIKVVIWQQSTGEEFHDVTVSWNVMGGNFNGKYNTSLPFVTITSIVANVPPAKPTLANPLNNSGGNPLTGMFEWNEANRAETYNIQVSSSDDFTGTLLMNVGNIEDTEYTYNPLNLTNGQKVYWRVSATNAEGTGPWSDVWNFTTVLAAPALTAPADNATGLSTSVVAEWQSVVGADKYLVKLYQGGNLVDTYETTNTSYTLMGLAYYTTYTWTVTPVDVINDVDYPGAISDTRTFRTVVDGVTLTSPADDANGLDTEVTATWQAVTGATQYEVELSEGGSVISTNTTANTNFDFTGLDYYTEYSWRVRAQDVDNNWGAWSAIWSYLTAPTDPTLISPADNATGVATSGTFTWGTVEGAVSYTIMVSTTSGDIEETVATNSYAYTGLENHTDYNWEVYATDMYGNDTDPSAEWSFTTVVAAPLLTSPADNANGVNTSFTATWQSVIGAAGYEVELSEDGSVVSTNASATTSFNFSGLSNYTEYSWRVRAKDASDNWGAWSASWGILTRTTSPTLATPANNAVNVPISGNLTWNAVPGAVKYNLRVWTVGDVINTEVVGATSYAYTNLDYLTAHQWEVTAIDEFDNESAASASRTFTTIIESPAVPTLVSPANNEEEVALTGNVEWNSSARAELYDVEIATDNAFDDVVFSGTDLDMTEAMYTALNNDTDHFWRVRARNVGGYSAWSSVWTFTTMFLAPPVVSAPTNGSDWLLFESIDVMWETAQGADSYNVQVSTDPTWADEEALLADLEETEDLSLTLEDLAYGTTYYIRTQSVSESGNSNWSANYSFSTIPLPGFVGDGTVCAFSKATYTILNYNPDIDYEWIVSGGDVFSQTGATVVIEWDDADDTATLTLIRESDEWGEFADFAMESVEILETTIVDIEIITNFTYDDACINEALVFTYDTEATPLGINWYVDGDGPFAVDELNWVFSETGVYVVTVDLVGDDCTIGTDEIIVTVVDDCPIHATILGDYTDDNAVCPTQTGQVGPTLQAKVWGGDGTYNYNWIVSNDFVTPSGTIYAPDEDIYGTIKSIKSNKSFSVYVYDESGNNTTANKTVHVKDAMTFTTKALLVVTQGDIIDLNDEIVTNISGGTAPYTFNWNHLNGGAINDPENYSVETLGIIRLQVVAKDADDCQSVTRRPIIWSSPAKFQYADDVVAGINGNGIMYSYPNPVRNNINVVAQLAEQEQINIQVLDLLGKVVMSYDLGTSSQVDTQINLESLTAGAYTIVLTTSSETIVKPFIKE